jgi:hypothetical protein
MTVDTDWLRSSLESDDPVVAMKAATAAAYVKQNPAPTAKRRIFDRFYKLQGEVNDHIELRLNQPRQSLPSGGLVLKGGDSLADAVLKCDTEVVPFIYDKGGYRWSGRVDVAHDKLKNGLYTVECELVHDKTFLDRICCWPDPEFPIEFQWPFQNWFGIGPAITVMKTLIQEQVWRLQLGLWEIVNDIGSLDFDWQAWFGALLMQGSLSLTDLQQMLTTPIYVVPTDPIFDTSPWIEIDGRMDTVWRLCQQQLKDNGIDIQATAWLPGEPQPPGVAFPLQVATIVVDIKDRSNVTGFSGTFLDGIERDLVDLEGSLLGTALNPLLNPTGAFAPPGVNIAPAIGVDFIIPWVLFNCDNIKSGIIEHDVAHHHPLAWQILVGGHSPKWLDDLINATLEWAIDSLMIVIGLTGVPSDLLNGIFDDSIYAFTLVDNFSRREALGPYGFPEKFFPSGAGAATLDSFFQEIAALWDTMGYPAAIVSFLDGYPYTLGTDLFPGALAAVVRRGKLYVDYVENITIIDNRSSRNRIEVQIGDGKHEEAPITKIQRKIVDIENGLNIAILSPQS